VPLEKGTHGSATQVSYATWHVSHGPQPAEAPHVGELGEGGEKGGGAGVKLGGA
tara:strand:+ start:1942 stop:2103 length:162 start_codon:yes stop_codon:yes gene_type:complete